MAGAGGLVAATRALARKRTIVSGYVVKDLDDGATLTEQFADAATTTVAGRVEINQCVGYDIATPSSRRRVDGVEDDAMIQHTQVFGKPKTPDGRVLERALSARSSKSGKAYREVVKLIIRPPRAEYDVKKLGPTPFTSTCGGSGAASRPSCAAEFAVVNRARTSN